MVMPRSCSMSMLSSTWLGHLALGEAAGRLDQPVGQGRFAMVDMGDDGEIADLGKVGHGAGVSTGGAGREAGWPRAARGRECGPEAACAPFDFARDERGSGVRTIDGAPGFVIAGLDPGSVNIGRREPGSTVFMAPRLRQDDGCREDDSLAVKRTCRTVPLPLALRPGGRLHVKESGSRPRWNGRPYARDRQGNARGGDAADRRQQGSQAGAGSSTRSPAP